MNKIKRKLNLEKKKTDLFEELTGKVYEINNDHKTFLMVQELLKQEGTDEEKEENNTKALYLIIGEENWKEINEKIMSMPNYAENITVAQIEIFSSCYNVPFEEMADRFQKSQEKSK